MTMHHLQADEKAVIQAYNKTALELYSALRTVTGNVVISPYSVGTAMSMALSGAREDTYEEMAGALNQAIPRERIDVIYHGIDPAFRPLPENKVQAFRQRQGLPERFVLCVGTLEPRKNHTRLVEAFARIYDGKSKLVIIGGKGWLYDELFAKVEALGLSEAIVFPGYVMNEVLALWYNAATILAYPSLYEGFGMPILEAQACGTPVMTSDAPPLPEAAGDAALMTDPYSVAALAANLDRLLTDEPLRSELRERGLAHARQFTWLRTAQETARVYRRALEKGDRT